MISLWALVQRRQHSCTSLVHFDVLCIIVVATSCIVSLIGAIHPLTDLQLLQSVLVHLSLGQDEAYDTRGQTYHPIGDTVILLWATQDVQR